MKKWLMSIIVLALTLVIVGCANEDAKQTTVEEMTDSIKVNMASWSQPITEQTNLLVEEKKGFFKDEGIDLTFIPGAGGGDAIKNVLAGNADIAFTDAGSFFSALNQGEDLVSIYNIYPQNVFNVVAKKSSGIEKPEDLKGKTIGVYSLASGTRENLLILLHTVGLTEEDVEIVETGLLNFAPLMQDQVDATAATDTGLYLGEQKGLTDYNVMEVRDYLNFSSDMFVVTRDVYDNHKEELQAFLRAFQTSAQWMLDNPEEAATLAKKFAIDGQDEKQNRAIIDIRNTSSLQEGHELGYTNLEDMQQAIDVYEELGLIDGPIDIKKYMTNDLLPTGEQK